MLPLLRSVGILDPHRAEKVLSYPEFDGLNHELIVENLRAVPDPDNALFGLVRVLEKRPDLRAVYEGETLSELAQRLLVVLGISHAFTDWLVRDPSWIENITSVNADEQTLHGVDFYKDEFKKLQQLYPDLDDVSILRKTYRQALIGISLVDVESEMSEKLQIVCQQLSDLAVAAIQIALDIAQEEMQSDVPMAVIALGKCGARELNYLSDVDVMYVLADDTSVATLQQATEVAQRVGHIISGPGVEPPLFELDANLRPEGKDGPLVRTLESCREYYTQWAHLWEYQAMLKARAVAGDEQVGEEFTEFIEDLVWSASEREGFLESMRHLRSKVVKHIPKDQAEREIKLGQGGLRDIEFSVQLLQLVHGREDTSLHDRDTLSALEALTKRGYISRTDGKEFSDCYRFLRVLEHGTQLLKMKRTHLLPQQENSLRHLSRLIRTELEDDTSSLPLYEKLLKKWKNTKVKVRTIHERLFFQPILDSLVQIKGDELKVTLDEEGSLRRLEALGYDNPKQAMAHIKALTQGVSRKADLHRLLLPLFLRWFSDSVNPDKSLLNYRVISEQLGDSPWYLSMLRDS
ncbi:MAG: bifunctional [glutamine synthetase] adenylyltransferase/[glutamine synthetase]-adenylyl-L-tyrosine phosphorylase, partial [Micrococcaceae bacterium]